MDEVVRGLRQRQGEGVGDVLARLAEQDLSEACFAEPDPEGLPVLRHLPQCLGEAMLLDAGLAADLIAHCRVLLAGYKSPRSIDFVSSIPRTGTGKIQKAPLRAPYWEGHERRI